MKAALYFMINSGFMKISQLFIKKNLVLLTFLLISGLTPVTAQVADTLPNVNRVYDGKIRTVLLYKNGFEMSAPVMNMSAGEKLKLSFDEMDSDLKRFRYTIRHCEADWTTSSELMTSEYIDGFQDDAIDDFGYSYNTKTNFTHYSLVFPTSNLRRNFQAIISLLCSSMIPPTSPSPGDLWSPKIQVFQSLEIYNLRTI